VGGQKDADGLAQRAGQVGDGRVDRDHQIETGDDLRGVEEVAGAGCGGIEVDRSGELQQPRLEFRRKRSKRIVLIGRSASGHDADPAGASRHGAQIWGAGNVFRCHAQPSRHREPVGMEVGRQRKLDHSARRSVMREGLRRKAPEQPHQRRRRHAQNTGAERLKARYEAGAHDHVAEPLLPPDSDGLPGQRLAPPGWIGGNLGVVGRQVDAFVVERPSPGIVAGSELRLGELHRADAVVGHDDVEPPVDVARLGEPPLSQKGRPEIVQIARLVG
jgi:hypothetical protein